MNTKLKTLDLRLPRTLTLGLFAGICLGAAAAGCGLFDIPITLQTQEYKGNFGTSTGTVPTASCTAQADPCAQASGPVSTAVASSGATVTGICDTTAMKCTAQINATLSYPVTLSQDQSFATGVAGKAVSAVHSIQLKYGIPKNTLSFNLPELDLYIAPQGVTKVDDPQAVFIDKIPAVPKGQTSADGSGAITVDTASKAGTQFVYYIQNPQKTFTLLVNAKPVVHAGDAMPAGEIWVHVTPTITVGLPR
jgi:hypothetical protein